MLSIRYRCVICPVSIFLRFLVIQNYDLCGGCFRRDIHSQHQLVSCSDRLDWAPAPRKVKDSFSQHARFLQQLQMREISVLDYDLLLQLDQPVNTKMHDYLVESLPILTNLDDPQPCCLCSNLERHPILRSLLCGHYAHTRCLAGAFVFDLEAVCPLDSKVILPGLDPQNFSTKSVKKIIPVTNALHVDQPSVAPCLLSLNLSIAGKNLSGSSVVQQPPRTAANTSFSFAQLNGKRRPRSVFNFTNSFVI